MSRAERLLPRRPKPLRAGDLVALFAPSFGVEPVLFQRLELAIAKLQRRGLRVLEGATLRREHKQCSAPAAERAIELLPLLDLERLAAAEPKWFSGFSELSTVRLPLLLRADWMSLHGPALMELGADELGKTTAAIWPTLFQADPPVQRACERWQAELQISNPGAPLVKPERMIDLPPRSRNEALASLMRRMRMCAKQGSGLNKIVQTCEVFQLPAPLFRADSNATQAVLYGPRSFAEMTQDERLRACYFHAVLKFLSGDKMKNASLSARLGIGAKNAAQASAVISKTLDAGLIRVADPEHPRCGYLPH